MIFTSLEYPIVGVAIMLKETGEVISLPKPNRHHDVIYNTYMKYGKTFKHFEMIQGFITENGTFVNREVARVIAEKHKQLICEPRQPKILFSEDVW